MRCCLPQVDEVKNIMVDNIEKVLERGEKIELLVDKTDNLRFQVGASIVCRAPGRAPGVAGWLPAAKAGAACVA